MTMSSAKKDNYPLERFEKAVDVKKKHGNQKIGIAGASTTGMMALLTASYYSEITLTIAMTSSDFVMEGFYQDGLDGARERLGEKESSASYHRNPLHMLTDILNIGRKIKWNLRLAAILSPQGKCLMSQSGGIL